MSDININVNTGNLGLLAGNTTGAIYVNSLTTTERDGLTKVVGMIIWNSTTSKLQSWDGSVWNDLPGSGGSGSPAGANTQVQYNNNGVFGASSHLTWDDSTQQLITSVDSTHKIMMDGSGPILRFNVTGTDSEIRVENGDGSVARSRITFSETNDISLITDVDNNFWTWLFSGTDGSLTTPGPVTVLNFLNLPTAASAPSTPIAGQVYFDTTIASGSASGSIQVYDGTGWHTVVTG